MTLTIGEIKDLAEFAGLRVEPITDEDLETEIIIMPCPEKGVKGDGDLTLHYRYMAYYEEYPEEGVGGPWQAD